MEGVLDQCWHQNGTEINQISTKNNPGPPLYSTLVFSQFLYEIEPLLSVALIAEYECWLPATNLKLNPGNDNRVLIYENGIANWEGEDIDQNDQIPD